MITDSTRARICATMFTTKDDSSIFAAWERFTTARAVYSSLPHDTVPPGKTTTPAEDMQDEIMAGADNVIADSVATTLRGVEIKLWVLLHDQAGNEPSAMAAVREELDWCAEHGDYNAFDRLIIPAIRSLRRMADRPTQDAFAVKLARYLEAAERRDEYERANAPEDKTGDEQLAFEEAMGPLHSMVFDTAVAVLREPSPDLPALVAKRGIFDEMEMWGADEPEIMKTLFADAIALAGGAA
jgi:hypothetical protein